VLIKAFFDFIEIEGKSCFNKINLYLRMNLIELTNDFMKTFEDFFMKELHNIKTVIRMKKTCSVFEFFNQEVFFKYLNEENVYFNLKYVNDKRKNIELYTNFIQTKLFKNYLTSSL